jgi:hypothetical protein
MERQSQDEKKHIVTKDVVGLLLGGVVSITVHLTSIYNPQIEGKFTETSGGSTNLFYGCKD